MSKRISFTQDEVVMIFQRLQMVEEIVQNQQNDPEHASINFLTFLLIMNISEKDGRYLLGRSAPAEKGSSGSYHLASKKNQLINLFKLKN